MIEEHEHQEKNKDKTRFSTVKCSCCRLYTYIYIHKSYIHWLIYQYNASITIRYWERSKNNITDVQSIGDGLKTNNTLKYLHLDSNNITDDSGIQSIIDGLKTNNTLRLLDLYNNQLSSNMKSQLKAIKQYKKDGSNGYQQVEGMWIGV